MSRLMELFDRAVDLGAPERRALLDDACAADPELRRQVESLLAADDAAEGFLNELEVEEGLLDTLLRGGTGGDHRAQVGETLGAYELRDLIGKGAMGWVFRARHGVLGREVAVKVLRHELVSDPQLVARFFAEAKVVNAIRHPNLIDVTDFVEERDPRRVGYVMALLEGASLAKVLEERRLGRMQALNVAWQLLDALDAIHGGGVVHRDLKPDNIFVVGDLEGDLSEVPSVVVLDFGVAKIAERQGYRTATGVMVGTPAYMAPEQVRGEEVGPPADLYAWALIVIEMLTGVRVHAGSAAAVLQAKLSREGPPLPPVEVEDELQAVMRILQQGLAPVPGLRPEARELRAPLLHLLGRRDGRARRTLVATVVDARAPDSAAWREWAARFGSGPPEPFEGGVALEFVEAADALRFAVEVSTRLPAARVGIETADGDRGRTAATALARAAAPGRVLVGALTAQTTRTVETSPGALTWTSLGLVSVPGLHHPLEVYAVGAPGGPPASVERMASDPTIRGWRPSPGSEVPGRAPWRLVRALGVGGFGEVWVAEDGASRRVFKFGFDARAVRSLEREARLHRRLDRVLGDRRDILTVFGLHQGPPPFLETEHVEGGDLYRWLNEAGGPGALPVEQRIEFVAQAAEALAEVHAVGVLHRDIKPANLLVRPGAEGPRIVLADFGIGGLAEGPDALTSDEAPPAAPDSVQLAGTFLYLAPERLAGHPASVRADLYALGVVLFQLLVEDLGRPVGGDWRSAIDDPVLRDDLEGLLEEDPRRRTADAGSLARSLRALETRRHKRAEEVAAAAAAARARRFVRVALPALLGLLLVIGVVAFQAWRIQLEADRANRESATASRTVDFLVDLFEVSDPSADPPTVREVLDRGASRLRTELNAEPLVRARLMSTVGRVYANLGMFEPARALSEEALALRENVLGPVHPVVAESHHQLGDLERSLSRFSAAEAEHRRALALREKAFGADHPTTAESLNMIAQLVYLRGEPEEAEALYLRALEIRERTLGAEDLAVAETASHLGWLHTQRGEYAEAEAFLRRALDIRERALGAKHFRVAETLFLLADVYLFQGKLELAEKAILRTLALQRAALEPDHRRIGITLITLGALRRQQGRLADSGARLQEAIMILEKALGPDNLDVGQAHYEHALTQEQAGLREAASESLSRALPIYEGAYGPDHPKVAMVLNNLGSVLGEGLGRPGEAAPLLERAIRIFDEGASPEPFWQALARWTLANVLREEGRYAEARPRYREAMALLERAGQGRAENPDLPALRQDLARLETLAAKAVGLTED